MAVPSNMYTLYSIFVILALVSTATQQEVFDSSVHDVIQNFNTRFRNRFRQIVLPYHNLELAYKFYASYYDRADVSLPGFKKFFHHLEENAFTKANEMITYINKRGGYIQFAEIKLRGACTFILDSNITNGQVQVKPHLCNFLCKDKTIQLKETNKKWMSKPGLQGLEEALALEKHINSKAIELSDLAKKGNDPHAKVTIEMLIDHQVETIKKVADILHKLQDYPNEDYSLREYLLDIELDK